MDGTYVHKLITGWAKEQICVCATLLLLVCVYSMQWSRPSRFDACWCCWLVFTETFNLSITSCILFFLKNHIKNTLEYKRSYSYSFVSTSYNPLLVLLTTIIINIVFVNAKDNNKYKKLWLKLFNQTSDISLFKLKIKFFQTLNLAPISKHVSIHIDINIFI